MVFEHIVDIVTLLLLLSVAIDKERDKAQLEKRIEKLECESNALDK
jgi:hypothetical protein